MKGILKVGIISICLLTFTGLNARGDREEKILNKHKEIVENAAPDDWHTLAKSAEACLSKNINQKEVAAWIEKSLDIKQTSFNLEVKGNYYMTNNLPEKACEYYLKAIETGMRNDPEILSIIFPFRPGAYPVF